MQEFIYNIFQSIKEQADVEKELKKLEISKLKEQWDKDLISEKVEKETVRAANKQVYRIIEDFNRKEDSIRHERSEYEKLVHMNLYLLIIER